MATDPTPARALGGPPPGWYPDPAGLPRWRRWDGTTWSDSTMPFGGPPVDPRDLARERLAWGYLRPLLPVCVLSPALAGVALAASSGAFGGYRHWFHAAWHAALLGRALPPQVGVQLPSALNWILLLVYALSFLGLLAWVRFATSSMRVASAAAYPQRLGPLAATVALLLPVAGPLVASGSSAASLPTGHEARGVLRAGWGFVAAGEALLFVVGGVVGTTPSLVLAWLAAACCAVCWVAAALELQLGLAAVAEDHETLDVRRAQRDS